jgi:hypothetical protein
MEVTQSIEGIDSQELVRMEKILGDQVSDYSTVITRIAPDDSRDPPGELHGTGWFVEIAGQKFVLTCEHVARAMSNHTLCASFHGSEVAFDLTNRFSALTYPVDVALTAITENTWKLAEHHAKCIPLTLFAEQHSPVENEVMYVAGYPGELARNWPATLDCDSKTVLEPGVQFYTTIALMCQIQEEFDPTLNDEPPPPIEGVHFLLPYTPEHAEYMSDEQSSTLPRAPGLSGSLVWNTRYMEITRAGGVWRPEDARVTGIVWGNSTKAGVLCATPIQFIWDLVNHTATNIKAGLPYWEKPKDGK